MATKRKTAAEIREEETVKAEEAMMDEEVYEGAYEDDEPDDKDAEIAKLRAEISRMRQDTRNGGPLSPGSARDMDRIMAIAEDAAESGTDPWSIKVPVRIPKKGDDEDYWININGIAVQIPANGEVQELKLPWAMALMDSIYAEERTLDFADSVKVYDPVTNPRPVD